MTTSEQVRLLEAQMGKIGSLEKKEDHDTYDEWHKQTELLLKSIFGNDADEVHQFRLHDGQSAVISGDRQVTAQYNTESYFRHLKKNQSLLSAIVEFLKSNAGQEEKSSGKPVSPGTLDALHDAIKAKCSPLYLSKNYSEAVEKSFKVVRDRLRTLTGHERGSEAFGKGGLYIKGAAAPHVDKDFQQAVQFLVMAIDFFRNEKSHSADGNIDDPIRAYEYLAISSLAMHLLDNTEIKSKP
jgi:uncharacterized protein (TIGR02391 family)